MQNAGEPASESGHGCDAAALHELKVMLHDGLSQELFAAELDLHELRSRADLPPDVREVVDRIEARVRSGSAQLRCALLGQRAEDLGREPALALVAEAEAMLNRFADRTRIATALVVGGTGMLIEDRPARVLRRAVQEGLANVGKHARASQVQLALHRGATWWSVQIDDDGDGDPDLIRADAAQARSFGLSSLGADAARVGGRLCIATAPSLGGVRLEVAVPVGPATTG